MNSLDKRKCYWTNQLYWTNLLKEDIPALEIPTDFKSFSEKLGNISYTSVYRKVRSIRNST